MAAITLLCAGAVTLAGCGSDKKAATVAGGTTTSPQAAPQNRALSAPGAGSQPVKRVRVQVNPAAVKPGKPVTISVSAPKMMWGTARSAAFGTVKLNNIGGAGGQGTATIKAGVRPGTYPVTIDGGTGNGPRLAGTASLTVGSGKPQAGKAVVKVTGGRPGATVTIKAKGAGEGAYATSRAFVGQVRLDVGDHTVWASGRTTLKKGLAPGTYTVSVVGKQSGTGTVTVVAG